MKTRKIESLRNPIVKDALAIRDKRPRPGYEAFLVEGPNLVEAAMARASLGRVFFTARFGQRGAGLLERLERQGAELTEVAEHVMKKLSETETPQGVAAVASLRPAALEAVDVKGLLVVSDGIQDPGNIGAVIRTADAAGAGAVVLLPGTCDPFMPKALRASAGSVFNVPLVYAEREGLERALHSRGLRVVATTLEARLSLFEADLRPPVAFIFGNETAGVSLEMKGASDLEVKVPIRGGAESLNVAASAAVCLYEALRQKAGGAR
jgi:TrmH family RNA methyltransferase